MKRHWSYHLAAGLYILAQIAVGIAIGKGGGGLLGLLAILCWGATFLFGAAMFRLHEEAA